MNWSNEWNKGVPPVWPTQKDYETIVVNQTPSIWYKHVELTIPIKNQWPRKVRAIQVGSLAVHEQLLNSGMAPYKWQVTHVPTLSMFDRAIPDGDWTQEILVKWCWKVQQSYSEGWELLNSFDNSNYKDIPKGLLDWMQTHCLSILPGEI